MKVIHLLNKIANGEEVPKKIKYSDIVWCFNKKDKTYYMNNTEIELFYIEKLIEKLNDEVEIIEEPKGIPEKLKIEQDTPSSNYYIKNEYGTKCALTKHSKIIADKVNELLDYLESKGE